MSDLIDKHESVTKPDFVEQMRAAEEAAGISLADSYYVSDEYPATKKTLDALEAAGVEIEQPAEPAEEATPEDATVEAEAPVEEAAPEPEAEVVDPLADLNKKVGQFANDNADLRRANEELRQLLEQQQQPQQQQNFQFDNGYLQQLIEENPGQAAYEALLNKQPHLYDQAIRAWHEIDPVAAGRYERQVEQATLVQGMQAALQPQIQGAQELATKSQLEQALVNVASRHEDYQEVMGAMSEDAIQKMASDPSFPKDFLEQKLMGGPQDKEQVYETLYRWRKAEIGSQLVEAAREAPARQNEEARQAKREAFVGSATTTTPDEVPESEGERLTRVWKEARPSLRDAWNHGAPSRLGR